MYPGLMRTNIIHINYYLKLECSGVDVLKITQEMIFRGIREVRVIACGILSPAFDLMPPLPFPQPQHLPSQCLLATPKLSTIDTCISPSNYVTSFYQRPSVCQTPMAQAEQGGSCSQRICREDKAVITKQYLKYCNSSATEFRAVADKSDPCGWVKGMFLFVQLTPTPAKLS